MAGAIGAKVAGDVVFDVSSQGVRSVYMIRHFLVELADNFSYYVGRPCGCTLGCVPRSVALQTSLALLPELTVKVCGNLILDLFLSCAIAWGTFAASGDD